MFAKKTEKCYNLRRIMMNHFSEPYHLSRRRINALLAEAVKAPLVTVCAGAGCGKTRAVSDFLRQQNIPAMWTQFGERDNLPSRFWESCTAALAQINERAAEECKELGFPDTADKLKRFLSLISRSSAGGFLAVVFDDFHLARESAIIHFVERVINGLPKDRVIILIYRDLPKINITALQIKGFAADINENDLNFTESELSEYLKQQGLPASRQIVKEIYKDTGGWAFAVNLAARSLKRTPHYFGYVKDTLKQNIFGLMELESWAAVPERLQRFLIRLSLIDHPSAKLVCILADGDDGLLSGLKEQSAYIRFDGYAGAYQIHHLFLDFLRAKQYILTDAEKRGTYKEAADWCKRNSFKTDAFGYYEKIGDYESVVSMFWELFEYTTPDVLLYVAGIFDRAPAPAFDSVLFFAAAHLLTLCNLGRWQEFFMLAEAYERKFLMLPGDDIFRNHTLGAIYYLWGNVRFLISAFDGRCDFDLFYAKAGECFINPPEKIPGLIIPLGPWAAAAGSAKAVAPLDYIEAVARSVKIITPFFSGVAGFDDLCLGEIKFYQNDLREAETLFIRALTRGRKHGQSDTVHRSLFYILRTAIMQGNRVKTEQALKDLEALLDEAGYSRRFFTYDIVIGWYYGFLHQPEKIPDWLKGDFTPYGHAYFLENYGNQIKARCHYLTRKHPPLLSYIAELKQRESILYGRVEMLAMEACVHYRMKNKKAALNALCDAYAAAAPNDIMTPFIELGKDMRTLTMAALREEAPALPRAWLETVRYKAASYARNQSMFIAEYTKNNGGGKALSPRERDVLCGLYNGLTQSEIAEKRKLSVNTIKMITKRLYEKLYVNKISDLIRIAAEQRLVP